MKLQIITVGQSPRKDIIEMFAARGIYNKQILIKGLLDGVSDDFSVGPVNKGQTVIFVKLRSGKEIIVQKSYLTDILHKFLLNIKPSSKNINLLWCTGEFLIDDDEKKIVQPIDVIKQTILSIYKNRFDHIGIICPTEYQVPTVALKWQTMANKITVYSALPFSEAEITKAARNLRRDNPNMVILDCMSYSNKVRSMVKEVIGRPVVLPQSIIVSLISLLY